MVIQRQSMICTTDTQLYYQMALLAWHVLMLSFGAFIAWETRNVGYMSRSLWPSLETPPTNMPRPHRHNHQNPALGMSNGVA